MEQTNETDIDEERKEQKENKRNKEKRMKHTHSSLSLSNEFITDALRHTSEINSFSRLLHLIIK